MVKDFTTIGLPAKTKEAGGSEKPPAGTPVVPGSGGGGGEKVQVNPEQAKKDADSGTALPHDPATCPHCGGAKG